jgi:hypothetical protein
MRNKRYIAHVPKPAFSYIRFSSSEQSKGDSLRRQTALAEEYAQRHGLQLDRELTFRDLGISAFNGKNKTEAALAAFIKACKGDAGKCSFGRIARPIEPGTGPQSITSTA